MPRPRRAAVAALLAAVTLGACTGSGDATQGSVRDDVRETLLERDEDRPAPETASAIADCVARGLFEGDFTKEERNEAARAVDGDEPDDELVRRVQALVGGCEDDAEADAGSDTEPEDVDADS